MGKVIAGAMKKGYNQTLNNKDLNNMNSVQIGHGYRREIHEAEALPELKRLTGLY